MRPWQWWAEFAPPPGWNRVKVSENLGATVVAPVDTSLILKDMKYFNYVSKKIAITNNKIEPQKRPGAIALKNVY